MPENQDTATPTKTYDGTQPIFKTEIIGYTPKRLSTPYLNAALANAQKQFVQPEKNKAKTVKNKDGNPLYTVKYADLKNIIEAFRPHLASNGLAFTQSTKRFKNGWRLVLELRHESGEMISTSMPIQMDQAPQALGGTLTYFKRYQASAFFGIAADDDDDGVEAQNAAKGEGNKSEDTKGKADSKPPAEPRVKQFSTGAKANREPAKEEPKKLTVMAQLQTGANYTFPKGFGGVTGKKIGSLAQDKLQAVFSWIEGQMKSARDAQWVETLKTAQANIQAYFTEKNWVL